MMSGVLNLRRLERYLVMVNKSNIRPVVLLSKSDLLTFKEIGGLITLEGGAMVVDTPGMRELENFSVETGLDETFGEITALTEKCRFKDCSHTSEKRCAVLEAVKEGALSEKYRNYMKMIRESIFNDMSYVEKRQKDKQFARHCKTVMTDRKKQKLFSMDRERRWKDATGG